MSEETAELLAGVSVTPSSQEQTNSYSSKVAELFYTAGNAFNRLGEIAVHLNAANVDTDESRWTDTEIDGLRNALLRFANDLEVVSDSLLTRSKVLIRRDIKRRTLHLGSEMVGGGTIGTTSRTIYRPQIKTEHSIYGEQKEESVPMVAENQTIAGTSEEQLSPLPQEEPPVLTPASELLPIKKEPNSLANTTIVRRSIPGAGTTIRRVQMSTSRSGGGQSLRLINTTPGNQQVVRQRIVISNSSNPGAQTYTGNRHLPYARVSNNPPQLVSASKTRLIPTSTSTPSTNKEGAWNSPQWRH